MAKRIAFQGELGAYSHQACAQARPDFEPIPCTTFDDVVEKTRSGEVELGMLAVENSTYGRVADVHSLLPKVGPASSSTRRSCGCMSTCLGVQGRASWKMSPRRMAMW